jgi:phosphocarrier protein
VTIINKLGLHARASTKFVNVASRFQSQITLTREGHSVDGKSIMGVMTLGAAKGTSLLLSADGRDENEAIIALEELIAHYFDESE